MTRGVQSFINDMTRSKTTCRVENGLVIYQIVPVDGALAGTAVETGVSVEELQSWPQVPPHWIHLHENVSFSQTNSETSSKSDWLKHSRDLSGWGDAEPGICWSGHVRAMLGEAVQ